MKCLFSLFFRVLLSTGVAILCGLVVIILYTNAQLPSVNALEDIQLQVPLKIYTADGKLIGEYGEKRRTPIAIADVPDTLKLAILATEDRRFYEHSGIDVRGLARASLHLLASGKKAQGASTITMQVARNFFLTRKKTFGRKLNEALLAIKIEKELPKDKILELYLNKIYFGKRAYGVQAAAQVYYGVTVDKLTLAQIAMLAGLPQAPSAINPINNPEAALKRRTHVLKRMLHYGFINEKSYQEAVDAPIVANYHSRSVEFEAPYVAEAARRELVEKFGTDVYTSGFVVYTTVDSRLQNIANRSVQEGLLEYDKRHGYRGPITQFPIPKSGNIHFAKWQEDLGSFPNTSFLSPAAVINVTQQDATALLSNGQRITLPFAVMEWAHRELSDDDDRPSHPPKSPYDVVEVGDVIYVQRIGNEWVLSQRPEVEAALVSLHPKNGAILAMVGGFDFSTSHFNRVTQSMRQPGSNFKPFVYAAALERGFTAASIINDAPIVFKDDSLEDAWRPQNDKGRFYGPTRLRIGLTQSRNLVSIRLLQALGVKRTIKIIQKFGFAPQRLPHGLSLALGTASVTPLEIATGYTAFANGGYKVNAHVIQHVFNDQNKLIYEATPFTACPECFKLTQQNIDPLLNEEQNTIDALIRPDDLETLLPAPRILEPQTSYIMTSILQDAIQTGTGRAALVLNRSDLAGKTGTTNNKIDAWYTGYNQSLVTSVWVGYDDPRSVHEYGSQAALPIWIKYMGPALEGVPQTKQQQPRGIVTVKIDPATGLLARPGQVNAIFEIFKQNTVPHRTATLHQPERNVITPSSDSHEESLF